MAELLRNFFDVETEHGDSSTALLEQYINEDTLRVKKDTDTESAVTPEAREREVQFQRDLDTAMQQDKVDLGNGVHIEIKYFQGQSSKNLQDGTTIGFGSWVVELHMPHPVQEEEETMRAFLERIKANFQDALCRVAHELERGTHYKAATAVCGLSYFANRKQANEFGFETEDVHEGRLKLTRSAYEIILQQRFGTDWQAWEKYLKKYASFTPPRWAYMSKQALIKRYGGPQTSPVHE